MIPGVGQSSLDNPGTASVTPAVYTLNKAG